MKRERFIAMIQKVLNAIADVEIVHPEYLPENGAVILATNHMSRFDIPLLGVTPTRPDIRPLVADKYLNYPVLRWFSEQAGAIWIDRSKADFTAFRQAIEIIKQGGCLGIAPEGTRSTTKELLEGKSGIVLLAIKTGVQVVPAGISGTETAVENLMRFKRPHLKLNYGPPFQLPALSRENREEELQKSTDEVMCRIAALLPEKYHGFYVGHPRIKELVNLQVPGD